MTRRNRVVVPCANCGTDLERTPSKAKSATNHFCDKQCYADWQSVHLRGKNNPGWKPSVSLVCEKCGNVFNVSPNEADKRRFCSQECAGVAKAELVEVECRWCKKVLKRPPWWAKREQVHFCDNQCRGEWLATQTGPDAHAYKGTMVQVQCSQCGNTIKRDPSKVERNGNFFCSSDCWNQWRSVNMRDEGNPNFSTPAIETYCAFCNKPILRKPWRFGETKRLRHFCCPEHRAKWCKENLVGERSASWKGGTIRYYGPNWNQQKRLARKRDGYRCQVCGKTQEENGQALDVHHIIPFRDFGYVPGVNKNYLQANALSNLLSLCRCCHMQAEVGNVPLQLKLL